MSTQTGKNCKFVEFKSSFYDTPISITNISMHFCTRIIGIEEVCKALDRRTASAVGLKCGPSVWSLTNSYP
jgi:hypothetical protein